MRMNKTLMGDVCFIANNSREYSPVSRRTGVLQPWNDLRDHTK